MGGGLDCPVAAAAAESGHLAQQLLTPGLVIEKRKGPCPGTWPWQLTHATLSLISSCSDVDTSALSPEGMIDTFMGAQTPKMLRSG